jgi:uncharacterized repeat protein (TIGR03803 family)
LGNDGNFYGTTVDGGIGFGNVFRVTTSGTVTSLASFNSVNGAGPEAGLVLGKDGIFYGSATFGGPNNPGFGTLFKITTAGVLTTLFSFHFTDGSEPSTRLIQANDGTLYGTTQTGGSTNDIFGSVLGSGTVFRITTNGVFTSLVLFHGTNGSTPVGSLLMGPDGNLYGATSRGGTGGGGTIFRIVLTPHLTGIARLANGNVSVKGTGPSGAPFRLLASTDVLRPIDAWTVLTNSAFATDGTFSVTDTGAANLPARFYRVSTP